MIDRAALIVGSVLVLAACGGGRAVSLTPLPVEPRCAAMSDTLSKYVSMDALPEAGFTGDARQLRAAAPRPAAGQTVAVIFVVRPDGIADRSLTEISGTSDPAFERAVSDFAVANRFVPGQVNGCNVLSRYTLLLQ